MSVDFLSASRLAVFNALNGNLGGVGVYDHVPYEPEGAPNANYPLAVIGDATEDPWEVDDKQGAHITHVVRVWSRYKGSKQINELQSLVKSLIHRQAFTASGYRFIDALHEFSDVTTLPDGITRMGVVRFRLTLQEA